MLINFLNLSTRSFSKLSAAANHLHSGDIRAAWVSAVVMLPQAVAFAVIAGLPPEMGIYASVIPVIVAALLGSAPRLISGPNTAVAVMLGAALLPLAVPGSAEYLTLAIALTAMIGIMQLAAGLAGAGRLLAVLPPFVSNGLSAGIGLAMIASQLAPATGLLAARDAAPWLSAWYAALSWNSVNPYAVGVAAAAAAAGLVAGRVKVRRVQPLIAAIVVGSIVAWLLDVLVGANAANLDRVGQLRVALFSWTWPKLNWDEWYIFKQLAHNALAISVVGGLQTVVIARSIAEHSNARRELLAQGAANISAALTGGFAGSGSFNRTAAHVAAGAQTRSASVFSAFILLALAWLAGPLFSNIAIPAVAGTVALIGWGLLRSGMASLAVDRSSRAATLVIAASAVIGGLEASLILATCLGFLAVCLAYGEGKQARSARFNEFLSTQSS